MRILAAVDGSPPSIKALERAVMLAEAMGGSLHIVTVVHLSGFYYSALASAVTNATEDDIETRITEAVWEAIEPTLASIPPAVKVEKVSARGYAGQEIVDHAEEMEADLIVVGSRGFGPIRASILGSTSRYVTHHAHCDVMVVRADDD
jgi:nucleotide-binding universal stress UspA family protein